MTDLSRGTRARRSGRRPGWVLLTVLLVLAIGASSALVFTDRVELLKLAVILALWAAVCLAVGFAIHPWNPIIKRICTTSFTIYSTGYSASGTHLVHRNHGGTDGALVIHPLSEVATARMFRFSDQTF